MHNDVAQVLGELRQDHKNMARLLNLLERESNRLYDDGEPDIELMRDVMHYMTIYPDAVHHPKEDRIYAELKNVRPELTSGFSRITVDHQSIAEQGMKLRNDLSLIEAGAMLKRNTVVADALRYVNTLRSHMQWEELDLFRRVDSMIRDGHKLLDTSELPNASDPVFGPGVEKRFGRLFKRITAEF
ncbi:MAG: hemerythrin domain-containing protein [Gammaproteobacteria bacterium]|nr:hemerythrin domain-containing protein [Gammaproteobacteria bacterium]MDH4315721.1 hemerythrin domain-containing protein [Gammaproteobacteria bacterium]MDH5213445.1 hemerythrin domain-containing protein [Gammaproteobacteria bacterium]MDH5499727.1 hemerythrin domain-containing protein [Gammaproteobacteria bacterium]